GRSLCSRRCAVAPSAPAFTHAASEAGEGGMLQIQKLVIHFTKALQPVLRAVEARDAKLADQRRRSAWSVGWKPGDGDGASGRGACYRAKSSSFTSRSHGSRCRGRWRGGARRSRTSFGGRCGGWG